MKLDLLKKQWLDIVFEGRNKSYGAYDLRKKSSSTNIRALIIGALVFGTAIATPVIADYIGNASNDDDASLDKKITTIKLPPKKVEPPKLNLPPPPPPPPPVDVVKFVKPVVAKKEEITEDPPKMKDLEDKKLGKENLKGDDKQDFKEDTDFGKGKEDTKKTEDDNNLYSSAGVEVKPEFPGGIGKFYSFVGKNYTPPDEAGLNGQVMVSFTVEKDGSLTDIKVLKDIGFGTGKEAIRVLNKCPHWAPAEQNGKKVRCTYQLPITIQTPDE